MDEMTHIPELGLLLVADCRSRHNAGVITRAWYNEYPAVRTQEKKKKKKVRVGAAQGRQCNLVALACWIWILVQRYLSICGKEGG